jgi:hypothetical protein
MLTPGLDSPTSEKRSRRVKGFILAAGAVMAVQALCLELRIPAVKPEFFDREAVEIKLTPKWRYGYVKLWHGAVLVKARNRDIEAEEIWKIPPEGPELDVAAAMHQELAAFPIKAVLEVFLYVSLLAYVFFGWGWLKQALLAKGHSRGRLLMAHVLGWLGLWLIAGAPLLLWGYGTPLFTNCVGPGALSASGIYLGQAPAYSFTVSYHYLLAALAPVCLIFLAPISFALVWLPGITEGQVLWLGGLLFFLSIGLMRALLRG